MWVYMLLYVEDKGQPPCWSARFVGLFFHFDF